MKIFDAGQQIDVPGRLLFDQASPTVLYVGEALPGRATSEPSWAIRKLIFDGSGNPLDMRWAAGGAPTCVWDDRATLDYGV